MLQHGVVNTKSKSIRNVRDEVFGVNLFYKILNIVAVTSWQVKFGVVAFICARRTVTRIASRGRVSKRSSVYHSLSGLLARRVVSPSRSAILFPTQLFSRFITFSNYKHIAATIIYWNRYLTRL